MPRSNYTRLFGNVYVVENLYGVGEAAAEVMRRGGVTDSSVYTSKLMTLNVRQFPAIVEIQDELAKRNRVLIYSPTPDETKLLKRITSRV